jgi:uncharacterized delta-60 repeat protein
MSANSRSLILAVSVFFVLSTPISAAPGDLDLTFSGDGKLTDWLSRGDDSANGVAIQPDGKILVAGTSNSDFAVARYNIDGSLDATFGTGGKVTTDFNSSYDWANAIAIQPDGKIVVAGKSGGGGEPDFALVRYNSDGSLDTSFGSNGKVTTDIDSGAEEAYSVAIYSDGKIVAGGRRSTYDSGGTNDFAVVRYNTDGSLDTTFDSDGKVTTDIPSAYDVAYSVAIQTDGKIVAAGRSHNPSIGGSNFTLVRYNVDGSLDSSFDGDGKVTTQVGSASSEARTVAIQPDGKIVAAGSAVSGFGLVRYSSNGSPENIITTQNTNDRAESVAIQPDGKIVAAGGSNDQFAVVRLNANFSIDTAFGTNGRVTTPIGSYAWAHQIAVQTDGKIVATGYGSGDGNSADFVVVRYDANGSLDTSFDGDGKVTTDFGFFQGNALYDTAIQADGKIVAAGEVRTFAAFDWGSDFVLLRYNSDGSPDTTFGSGTGKVRTDMGSRGEQARAVAIQPDGKIVVAGESSDQDDNSCCFALARYNVDGSLDATFGVGGRVITGSLGISGAASDVVIQPDGKIVAAGNSNEVNYPNGGFAVYRYNSNGSLDTSFDGDGRVITPIGSSIAFATTVRIQPDGKIVAAGFSIDGSYRNEFAVVRYNGDGSLDTTFDGDGIVTTQTSQQDEVYFSSVIQPDGKIIVAGSRSINSNETGFALIRYNGNGSLDTTFGAGGVVTTQVGLHSGARAVALQPDGKIVASGSSSGVGNSGDFAVVRYNANGSLDTAFGGDGISTVDFGSSNDQANGMALDGQGRAVVVGTSDGRFAIARFLGGAPSSSCLSVNPIDCPDFFVRQHYLDFLSREPDSAGLAFWTNELTSCGADAGCAEAKRVNVSAAFFLSIEFQETGYLAYRFYKAAYGDATDALTGLAVPIVRRSELTADAALVGQNVVVNSQGWEQRLEANKRAYALAFVQRQRFTDAYPTSLTPAAFVARLNENTGGALTQAEADALVAELSANQTAEGRASVLRKVAENSEVERRERSRAFVLMQYFGYLRRDPDAAPDVNYSGYQFWLSKLDQFNGDHVAAEMVKAFISSDEYRRRFGQP